MAVTWNMGGETPKPDVLDKLLLRDAVVHDMYVFATQEALCSIAKSVMNPNKMALN